MSAPPARVENRRMVYCHPPVGLSTLFRPLPKRKGGARPALDITYRQSAEGPYLRFSGRAALGIPEQTLLLAIMELAKQQFEAFANDVVVNAGTESEIGRELWNKLHKDGVGTGVQTLRLETSWHELNRRCGAQIGGTTQELRQQQLERLCEVIVWECQGDKKGTKRQSYLVALLVGNNERIHLALNSRLASALLGQPYAQVSMTERLALDEDIPMALHAFLSTTIAHGRNLKIGVERLVERLWPGSSDTAPRSTHRGRRKEVRDGLIAIGRLEGWNVGWVRADMAIITRRGAGVGDMTSHIGNKTLSYPQQALPIIIKENNGLRTFDASGIFFNKNTSA